MPPAKNKNWFQKFSQRKKTVPASTLPLQLKESIEALSGIAMKNTTVHFNSDKPAQLSAEVNAQGSDIHIAPGASSTPLKESWHVVQQKQGRVTPTSVKPGHPPVNDIEGLEKAADEMGMKAGMQKRRQH